MKAINIDIPEDLYAALHKHAWDARKTKAELIRQWIAEGLGRPIPEVAPVGAPSAIPAESGMPRLTAKESGLLAHLERYIDHTGESTIGAAALARIAGLPLNAAKQTLNSLWVKGQVRPCGDDPMNYVWTVARELT